MIIPIFLLTISSFANSQSFSSPVKDPSLIFTAEKSLEPLTAVSVPNKNSSLPVVLFCSNICEICDNNGRCSVNHHCMEQVNLFYEQKVTAESALKEIPPEEESEGGEEGGDNGGGEEEAGEDGGGEEEGGEDGGDEDEEEEDEDDEEGSSMCSQVVAKKQGKLLHSKDFTSGLMTLVTEMFGTLIDHNRIKILPSKADPNLKYVLFAVDSHHIDATTEETFAKSVTASEGESVAKELHQSGDEPTAKNLNEVSDNGPSDIPIAKELQSSDVTGNQSENAGKSFDSTNSGQNSIQAPVVQNPVNEEANIRKIYEIHPVAVEAQPILPEDVPKQLVEEPLLPLVQEPLLPPVREPLVEEPILPAAEASPLEQLAQIPEQEMYPIVILPLTDLVNEPGITEAAP